MDQLRAMEIFVEVARLRGFSAAGRRLGLTRAWCGCWTIGNCRSIT